MKTLLIYNSKSVNSVLIKKIVTELIKNIKDYTFLDTEKSIKYYAPNENENFLYDKFIFIETYPEYGWFLTNQGTKLIDVFSNFEYESYIFNGNTTNLYLTETFNELKQTLANLFLKTLQKDGNILDSTFETTEYNKKIRAFLDITSLRILSTNFNKFILAMDLNKFNNILSKDNVFTYVNFNTALILKEYNSLQKEEFITEGDSYLSIIEKNPLKFDSLIKENMLDYLTINEIEFIEYVKFVENNFVELTFIASNKNILFDPNYIIQFGLIINEQKIIKHLTTYYEINFDNFMNTDNSQNIDNHYLTVNYDNSITIRVPIDLYLSVKNANQIIV